MQAVSVTTFDSEGTSWILDAVEKSSNHDWKPGVPNALPELLLQEPMQMANKQICSVILVRLHSVSKHKNYLQAILFFPLSLSLFLLHENLQAVSPLVISKQQDGRMFSIQTAFVLGFIAPGVRQSYSNISNLLTMSFAQNLVTNVSEPNSLAERKSLHLKGSRLGASRLPNGKELSILQHTQNCLHHVIKHE